jgi:hypothetical protein
MIRFIRNSLKLRTFNYKNSSISNSLRVAPFLTGPPVSSLPLWRMTSEESLLTPWTHSQSQCQSYFTTGGLSPISSSLRRTPWDLAHILFSQLNTCGNSSYITSFLTRGWVCHLRFLLAIVSEFILGSESSGTRDHILVRFEISLFIASYESQGDPSPTPHGKNSFTTKLGLFYNFKAARI